MNTLLVGGALLLIVLSVLFTPLLYALGGYITGQILTQVFTFAGHWIINGFAAVGMEIPITALPHIGAMLGFVGSFFKAYQKNENKG